MTYYSTTLSSPFGPFSVAVDATGAVAATAFGDTVALRGRLSAGGALQEDLSRTKPVRDALQQLFAAPTEPLELVLAPAGSDFQQRVWQCLRAIPRGQTRTYGEIARQLGSSARAVGRANATNPICLLIPCHRVIGSNGTLTGFAFGEPLKRALLAWEGVTRWVDDGPAADLFARADLAGA